MSHYQDPEPDGDADLPCAFCAIISGEAAAQIIAETEDVLCFLDHLPATYGHVLVIPKQHFNDLTDIPDTAFRSVMDTAKRIANAMLDSCSASGINLVHATGKSAHQTVFHFFLGQFRYVS
ncbi:HIT family protein [Kitasatospora sp. NPDC088346]|uniref:HIT family protein n=1 Tax=Kitasatospora sp. NPDC088346 TaxID=3364073 RepID=UPI0038132BCE